MTPINTGFMTVLGGFQMLPRFSIRSSQWEPIDTFKCEIRLALLNVRTELQTDLRFSSDQEPVVRTDSNVYVYIL
jgi:hypothetical protein